MRQHLSRVGRWLAVLAVATLCAVGAEAQRTSGPGYLFGAPDGSVTLRLGYSRPSAGSDLFSYTTSNLSLSKADFGAIEVGADVGILQGDHLEWLFSVDVAKRSADSDYRHFIGSDGLPIVQATTFSRVPLMIGVRYWLRPQGTTVGKLAWVPSFWTPFIALQGGAMWYEFHQSGDFVNFSNGNAVFAGDLTSNGWTPVAAISAGAAFSLSPRFQLLTQARYVYANKTLGADFTGFQPIDLSGLSFTAGLSFRIH